MFSFWQQDVFFRPADIVIAGGGFMGLWSAYELKKQHPKLTITVLEKDSIPGGASVRNAGFACFGSPGELLADGINIGEEAMWKIVEMRYKGIRKIREILRDEVIDYDACGGYECFNDPKLFQQVADKLPWLNKGMQGITGKDAIFSIVNDGITALGMQHFKYMIANRLEGGLHSGKAIQALLQKLSAMDVRVLYGADVSSWQNTGTTSKIEIGGAYHTTIQANKFLITTNASAPQLTHTMPVYSARGQVLVTQPIQGLQLRGTFHYDEGFYYWRNVGNRILLGGARNQAFEAENTGDIKISHTIQTALETFLHQHIRLPSEEIRIDHRWAGIMGFTQNKQPVIQAIGPGVWAAIACNGMGVALTPLMAEVVVTQMMG
jgi:gamma-glutamylputrescine oxidase